MASHEPATVGQLRLATGFTERERDRILEVLRKLDRRLKRYRSDQVDLELSVKERDTPSQYVVLECWISSKQRFVATSRERELHDALMDVREDLWRQIDDAVNRRTPKATRGLRNDLR